MTRVPVLSTTVLQKYYTWKKIGVVGCGEDVVYLTSPGRSTDIAYSWARPAILVAGKGIWGMFLFLLILHFHSWPRSSLFLFHLLYYLFYLFSPSLGDDTKWSTRTDVSLKPNTIKHGKKLPTLFNTTIPSRKQAYIVLTPLNPTFIQ